MHLSSVCVPIPNTRLPHAMGELAN
jgi:hypothetical protein